MNAVKLQQLLNSKLQGCLPAGDLLDLVEDIQALLNEGEKVWCPHIAWYPDKGGAWRYADTLLMVRDEAKVCDQCAKPRPSDG